MIKKKKHDAPTGILHLRFCAQKNGVRFECGLLPVFCLKYAKVKKTGLSDTANIIHERTIGVLFHTGALFFKRCLRLGININIKHHIVIFDIA